MVQSATDDREFAMEGGGLHLIGPSTVGQYRQMSKVQIHLRAFFVFHFML
jgi:hypothetical protein